MIKTYEKGSNPYFEYAMLKYSQVAVVERIKKDDVLEHINKLEFKKVSDVWQLIHTHLENVNISLNVYHYPNYALPTNEKPTDKFDFICKNSKAMGAYQSGVLVNDFSYFVDSNIIAKQTANEFSQRKYELLHKVSAFTHLDTSKRLKEQINNFIAFVDKFNTLWNTNENLRINDELTFGDWFADSKTGMPHLVQLPYTDYVKKYWVFDTIGDLLDLCKQSTTPEIAELFNTMPETRYSGGDLKECSRQDLTNMLQEIESGNLVAGLNVETRKAFFEAFLTILHKLHNADFEVKLNQINAELAPHLFIPEKYIRLENRQKEVAVKTTIKRWQVGGNSYRTNIHYVDSQLLSGYTTVNKTGFITVSLFYHGLVAKVFYLNPQRDTLWYCTLTSNYCAIADRLIDVHSTTNKTFNYMIEVEYQTEYGKDKLENEAPPAEPYKIKKLHGNWVTHCGVLLDTGGKSEDDILQMENPPCPAQEVGEKYDLSIAQIDSVISYIDAFNSFFNQNEATQLTDDLTFGDWYSNTKSLSPAFTSYEYTDFFKKITLFESLSFILEKFKESKTPQVVEILSTMPQTKYKGGDLIELSKQEMINERQRLEGQNA